MAAEEGIAAQLVAAGACGAVTSRGGSVWRTDRGQCFVKLGTGGADAMACLSFLPPLFAQIARPPFGAADATDAEDHGRSRPTGRQRSVRNPAALPAPHSRQLAPLSTQGTPTGQ